MPADLQSRSRSAALRRAGWRMRRGRRSFHSRRRLGLFRTEAPEPSLHQPERVGVTPGERFRIQETRSSIGRRCHGLGLRPEAPQHRVHEPAGPRPAFLSRERHAGIHGRMRRDPIQDHQLVGAETEQVLEPGGHLGPFPGHQRSEAGIECLLSPQYPRDHLVREPAVVFIQLFERPIERRVERSSRADLREHVEGRSSGGQALARGHLRSLRARVNPRSYDWTHIAYASMPRSGDDGTATSRRGIRPARYASAAGVHRVPHRARHGHRIPRLGQRRVHQDAVHALLHREAGIRCGPDARVHDDGHLEPAS